MFFLEARLERAVAVNDQARGGALLVAVSGRVGRGVPSSGAWIACVVPVGAAAGAASSAAIAGEWPTVQTTQA